MFTEQTPDAGLSPEAAGGRHRAASAAGEEDQAVAAEPAGGQAAQPLTRRAAAGRGAKRKGRRALGDLAFVVVAALVLSFLLKTFLIQSFYIPSGSMIPTFELNDRVLVTKLAPKALDLHRGDIVVFHDPGNWVSATEDAKNQADDGSFLAMLHKVAAAVGLAPSPSDDYLIKRVIGLPGDRVSCAGPGLPVMVNGVAINEPYIAAGANPSDIVFDVVVPDGAIWVMGDNRAHSADSRKHMSEALGGAVAIKQVVGVAQVRTWPLSRLALLKNPAAVFADVPEPGASGGGDSGGDGGTGETAGSTTGTEEAP
ncbi:MAG: signal peptidase I [Bifidobacteriaceae bacterium]|nr:signal peptidase I [Bifidobacteriaceae bacterium]